MPVHRGQAQMITFKADEALVKAMADIMGEGDFSLLFNKGKNVNIHYKSIASKYLLINIFNKDLSLGFLRLKVTEVVKKVKNVLHIHFEEETPNIVFNLTQQPLAI